MEQKLIEELPFEVEEDKKIARIKKMIPRGVVLLTYIVAENEDGMYLIDQHAAAERINYEKILKQMKEKPIPVDLLVPIKIELRKDEYILAEDRLKYLKDYGFNPKVYKIVTANFAEKNGINQWSNTGVFPLEEENKMKRDGQDFFALANEQHPDWFIE